MSAASLSSTEQMIAEAMPADGRRRTKTDLVMHAKMLAVVAVPIAAVIVVFALKLSDGFTCKLLIVVNLRAKLG